MRSQVEAETSASLTPEEPSKESFAAVVSWLDAGLRRGLPGRLLAEFPLSLTPEAAANQRVVYRDGDLAAHAMLHEVTIRAEGHALRAGMIGMVYTDPLSRGLGLATRCVEACLSELRRRGTPLAMLWSDKHDFYARMGFGATGCELLLTWEANPGRSELACGPPRAADWPALERLYARKPVRVERQPGDLLHLASGPETCLRVARSSRDEAVAYAVAGRGDDFAGCVHEWAGDPLGVVTCIDSLAHDVGAHLVMAGPPNDPVHATLIERASETGRGFFALAKILDRDGIWRQLLPDSAVPAPAIPEPELLELLFGAPSASNAVAMRLPGELSRVALRELPWPLYVWGLDSI